MYDTTLHSTTVPNTWTQKNQRKNEIGFILSTNQTEMGHHRPAALSSITDGQGRYQLFLPTAGKYYVGARHGYGDNPAPGEMFGHYEGTPDHSLTVESNRFLEEIGITVNRVLVP